MQLGGRATEVTGNHWSAQTASDTLYLLRSTLSSCRALLASLAASSQPASESPVTRSAGQSHSNAGTCQRRHSEQMCAQLTAAESCIPFRDD